MLDDAREWIETDGQGGYASGTVSGIRTRRYHGLLLVATTPPTGRVVLVNGIEARLETAAGQFALSAQRYTPDVVYPDGWRRLESFTPKPFPTWTFRLEDETRVEHSIFAVHECPMTILRWNASAATGPARLTVRPLLSGRDYHCLHRENGQFCFESQQYGDWVIWQPYAHLPPIAAASNGAFEPGPLWFRNFQYDQERERGLDYVEDLGSPGDFHWDLSRGEAFLVFFAGRPENQSEFSRLSAGRLVEKLRKKEAKRRNAFSSPLDRAADAYLVRRGSGKTIVAGYPWFTDWGRDTFIALRGLCLSTGRLDDARELLLSWASAISEGMLPNRFPDHGETPEYNSVDASLWYVAAVYDYLRTAAIQKRRILRVVRQKLTEAVAAIVDGYARGTRYGIRMDTDGLLAAGEPGVQLTWMDVKIGDWVVTPRMGKPVEVQALWLNALWIAGQHSPEWLDVFEKGRRSFQERFWNSEGGYLYDVVDVDHRPGAVDASFRPNQILAIGGLPIALLEGERARRVVDEVERRLWTPLGLRTLDPGHPEYRGRYTGGVPQRDAAYHQGTAWPWLAGPFVEAWVKVRGNTHQAAQNARMRFIEPLVQHLQDAGLGHVSEVADGDWPYQPRGCPFQAWSLGELLRIENSLRAIGRANTL